MGVCAGLLVCVRVCLLSVCGVACVCEVHLCVSGTVLPGCVSMCCENHCVSGCVCLSGEVSLDDFAHVSFPLCLEAPCLSVWPQIPPAPGYPAPVSPSPSSPFSASRLLGALLGYHVTVCARWLERGLCVTSHAVWADSVRHPEPLAEWGSRLAASAFPSASLLSLGAFLELSSPFFLCLACISVSLSKAPCSRPSCCFSVAEGVCWGNFQGLIKS